MTLDVATSVPDQSLGPADSGAATQDAAAPLSLQLREQTAELHREVERSMGLPQNIGSLAQYQACLDRFHRFYQPYEELLGRFDDWPEWEIDLHNRAHAPDLASDLEALETGNATAGPAPQSAMPALPEFAHALGALYVTEGSTLGSQFILRHLSEVLGQQIAGADRFFRGYGPETGTRWSQIRAALDRFGRERPQQIPTVIEGAARTFQAIGKWMAT